jgi:hypothetical protein
VKDLSLHLLDILENSARAGATRVDLHLTREGSWLTVVIADNGPGFPETVRGDPGDPYRTTRTERAVGLGLALFREAAEQSGGTLRIEEPPQGGVRLELRIDMGHIDARPFGDWAEALTTALLSWPGLDWVLRVGAGDEPVLDTARVKEEIGDIPVGHPRVLAHLRQMIFEGLAPVTDGLDEHASLSVMKTKKGAADEESG